MGGGKGGAPEVGGGGVRGVGTGGRGGYLEVFTQGSLSVVQKTSPCPRHEDGVFLKCRPSSYKFPSF